MQDAGFLRQGNVLQAVAKAHINRLWDELLPPSL